MPSLPCTSVSSQHMNAQQQEPNKPPSHPFFSLFNHIILLKDPFCIHTVFFSLWITRRPKQQLWEKKKKEKEKTPWLLQVTKCCLASVCINTVLPRWCAINTLTAAVLRTQRSWRHLPFFLSTHWNSPNSEHWHKATKSNVTHPARSTFDTLHVSLYVPLCSWSTITHQKLYCVQQTETSSI